MYCETKKLMNFRYILFLYFEVVLLFLKGATLTVGFSALMIIPKNCHIVRHVEYVLSYE